MIDATLDAAPDRARPDRPADAKPPRVTIITAAFNAAATIDETISSVVAQTMRDWEMIIVDDGSRDDTLTRARAWESRDARIRTVTKPNGGASSARNLGLEGARGEWVYFLDADDLLKPEGLARFLAAGSEADVVLSAHERVTVDGRRVGLQEAPDFADPLATLARACPIVPAAALVRADLARRLAGFEPSLAVCEDWDFWSRAARLGARFARTASVTSVYRLQQGSLSRRADRLLRDGLQVIERAYAAQDLAGDVAAREDARAHFALFAAAMAAGGGADPAAATSCIPNAERWTFDPAPWGTVVADALAYALAIEKRDLRAQPQSFGPRLDALVAALEARMGRCRQTRLLHLYATLDILGADAQAPEGEDVRLIDLDVAADLRPVDAPGEAAIVARVHARDRYLGTLEGIGADFASPQAIRDVLRRAAPRLAGRSALAGLAGARLMMAFGTEIFAPRSWSATNPRGAAKEIARRAAARAFARAAPAPTGRLSLLLVRDSAFRPADLLTRIDALRAAGVRVVSAAEAVRLARGDRAPPSAPHAALFIDAAALGGEHPLVRNAPDGATLLAPPGPAGDPVRAHARASGRDLGLRVGDLSGLARRPPSHARALLEAARAEVGAPIAGLAFAPGDCDEFTRRLARHAGFDFALDPEPAQARFEQDPMNWRRLELRRNGAVDQLVRAVGGGA